jgi:hypothetical protein
MLRRFVFIVLSGLILASTALTALAQAKPDKLKVSISAANPSLDPAGPIMIQVTVENETGQPISFKMGSLNFELTRADNNGVSPRSDRIAAGAGWKQSKAQARSESETDLSKLYWLNRMSSYIDPRHPKNLVAAVPPGEYYLVATLAVLDPNSAKGNPGSIAIKSNSILVNVKGKR